MNIYEVGKKYSILTDPVSNNRGTVEFVTLISITDCGDAVIEFDNGDRMATSIFVLGTNKRNCIEYVKKEIRKNDNFI